MSHSQVSVKMIEIIKFSQLDIFHNFKNILWDLRNCMGNYRYLPEHANPWCLNWRGIKTYKLLSLFLLHSAYWECQCVTLRIQTVHTINSKLKNIALLRPIFIEAEGYGTQTRYICSYSPRACVITYNIMVCNNTMCVSTCKEDHVLLRTCQETDND